MLRLYKHFEFTNPRTGVVSPIIFEIYYEDFREENVGALIEDFNKRFSSDPKGEKQILAYFVESHPGVFILRTVGKRGFRGLWSQEGADPLSREEFLRLLERSRELLLYKILALGRYKITEELRQLLYEYISPSDPLWEKIVKRLGPLSESLPQQHDPAVLYLNEKLLIRLEHFIQTEAEAYAFLEMLDEVELQEVAERYPPSYYGQVYEPDGDDDDEDEEEQKKPRLMLSWKIPAYNLAMNHPPIPVIPATPKQ